MVYQTAPHDQNDSHSDRLRSSTIAPWISSSVESEQVLLISERHRVARVTNGQHYESEQEDVMLQVGNLSLDDVEHINTQGADDAFLEQLQSNQSFDGNQDGSIFSEPQNAAVFSIDDDAESINSARFPDVISIHDYNRVLELSDPFEFNIPTANMESDSAHTRVESFISDFEISLDRIENIQREINEIRELYNNLLYENDEEDLERAEELLENSQRHYSDENDFRPNSDMNDNLEDDDDILSPIVNQHTRDQAVGQSFSDFVRELSDLNDENENFESQSDEGYRNFEHDYGLEDSDSPTSSWQLQQPVRRIISARERITNRRRNLLPNFYLDSNGIPRIELERQFAIMPRSTLSNDPSSKTAPFCTIDTNGDLECIVACYSSNSRGELKVAIKNDSETESQKLIFKEVNTSWRNDHGECIGR